MPPPAAGGAGAAATAAVRCCLRLDFGVGRSSSTCPCVQCNTCVLSGCGPAGLQSAPSQAGVGGEDAAVLAVKVNSENPGSSCSPGWPSRQSQQAGCHGPPPLPGRHPHAEPPPQTAQACGWGAKSVSASMFFFQAMPGVEGEGLKCACTQTCHFRS